MEMEKFPSWNVNQVLTHKFAENESKWLKFQLLAVISQKYFFLSLWQMTKMALQSADFETLISAWKSIYAKY